jgi:hypothetical protein
MQIDMFIMSYNYTYNTFAQDVQDITSVLLVRQSSVDPAEF